MNITIHIVAFLFAVIVLVLFHEYGHYVAARFFQVKVRRFSIGFGKPWYIWRSKKSDVEFAFAPILLGGYVRLSDSREEKITKADLPFTFDHKPILQRAIIMLAGPLASIMLAFFAFWLMLVIGIEMPKPVVGKILPSSLAQIAQIKPGDEIVVVDKRKTNSWRDVVADIIMRFGDTNVLRIYTTTSPLATPKLHQIDLNKLVIDALQPDPLHDLGIVPYKPFVPAIVGEVQANSPAYTLLQPDDKVVMVNHTKISSWDDLITYVQAHPEQTLQLKVLRHKQPLSVAVTSSWKFGKGWKRVGYIGVKSIPVVWPSQMLREIKYPLVKAFIPALQEIQKLFVFNAVVITKLILGKISLQALGGPLSIYQASTHALQQGIESFIGFLAVLSVMLAFFNLIPLPGLDGGYCFFLLIEGIFHKPLSVRVQMLIMRIGIILILLLFFRAMLNDVLRLF